MSEDSYYRSLYLNVAGIRFPDGTLFTSSGVSSLGFVGDGRTDNTAALNDALKAAYNAGGGTIEFPIGTFVIAGQINIPNDGSTNFNNGPLQPSIRITGSAGAGGLVPGGGGVPVVFGAGPAYGGSVLNLTYNSATAKIATFGTGMLEIDHLTLCDTSNDTATFLYSSNTTLHVHDVTFVGTAVGTSPTNDAIWLGNTSQTPSGAFNAPFQGYGTVINHCYFQNVNRAVFGQSFCNSVVISENTVWSSSGNTLGAPFEFGVSGGGQANGNYIVGNLIEATHYKYGIRIINGVNNKIIGNDTWDPTPGTFVSCVRHDPSAASSLIQTGISSPGTQPYFSNGGGLNATMIASRFGDPNLFSNPLGVELTATASLTAGQVVKVDPSNPNAVVVATTSDTGAGLAIGIVMNSPSAGGVAQVMSMGKMASTQAAAPLLGTGTATLGQFVIVDTTTNGRVKATSTYTAGTVIGVVITAQAVVGSAVGVLLGLR